MGSRKEQIGRHCPHCGAIITYDEYFCRACHTRLTDQLHLDAPGRMRPDTYTVAARKRWLSFLLSLAFPGLGQFYNGETLKGLAFGIAWMIVSFGSVGGKYQLVLLFGIWIAALAEALISALRINSYVRTFTGTSFLLWLGLAGLGALVLIHLYTGLPEIAYLRKIFPVEYFINTMATG
jgi:TM2 domain-containing membrane protein YozV